MLSDFQKVLEKVSSNISQVRINEFNILVLDFQIKEQNIF
jgi:hypothetical protein